MENGVMVERHKFGFIGIFDVKSKKNTKKIRLQNILF